MLLDPQRTLFIGMHSGAIPVRTSKFFDRFNVDDVQLLAWNVETFVAEIQEKTDQPFQSHHHSFVYHRFRELYEERIIQILQWVRQGHVLVILKLIPLSQVPATMGPADDLKAPEAYLRS